MSIDENVAGEMQMEFVRVVRAAPERTRLPTVWEHMVKVFPQYGLDEIKIAVKPAALAIIAGQWGDHRERYRPY